MSATRQRQPDRNKSVQTLTSRADLPHERHLGAHGEGSINQYRQIWAIIHNYRFIVDFRYFTE